MTVQHDVERALGIAESVMGEHADQWIDEPQECWNGRSPYELIESGRTDEVLAALHAERVEDGSWDGMGEELP